MSTWRRFRARLPLTVWLSAAVFMVVLTGLALFRHSTFGSQAFDLGIFDQGLWLLSRLKEPFVTLRGLNLFADHSSYLLILLVPLYWVWAHVGVLIALTVVALAAGGLLAYLVALQERAPRILAIAIAVAYLLHPAVSWNAWDSFHPEVLAIPLLLAGHLMLLRRRMVWGTALVLLVLLAKEDAALIVIPYGIYIGWRLRSVRLGVGIAAAATGVMLLNLAVLLPGFSPTGELIYTGRYSAFGDSVPDALVGMVTSPGLLFSELFQARRIAYLAAMLLPLLPALLAPEVLLIGVPITATNLLSVHGYQYDIRFHYTSYLLAVLVMAGAVGARRLGRWFLGRTTAVAAAIVAVAAIATILIGPLIPRLDIPLIDDRHPTLETPFGPGALIRDDITVALEMIPPDAGVSVDPTLAPHLSHRENVYVYPNPFTRRNWGTEGSDDPDPDAVDWIVARTGILYRDEEFRQALLLAEQMSFEPVFETAEVVVLRRR